ncbi:MAG: sigma-70 family RNA polymerase sigma factor [Winogradskyella sp.]|nr:sigma-70 family RNA polymerase sigma factor [Winogradskyella sp.]
MQDDKALVKRLQKRDEQALSLLYDKYSGAIYSVLLKMTRNEVLAQDLLQETFITVWDKAHQYNIDKGSFYTWVYRIARNKTLNSFRKQNPFIQTDDFSVYVNKTEDASLDSEFLELNGALSKLESKYKTAIELVYFKGFTHREAYKEMNVPLGTFKSYVRQALKLLRDSYDTTLFVAFILIEIVR